MKRNSGTLLLRRMFGLVGVRPEEARITLLMTLYFFLAMACVSTVKSLQNALYLSRVGFEGLPLLYVVLALASGLTVVVFRRFSGRFSRDGFRFAILTSLIVGVLIFLLLLSTNRSWVYPLFYVWSGIFSLLVPTMGWMLSYDLFTTRQAKRLFSVLGTGGILGGAAGGGYTALTAAWAGSRLLLLQVAVALIIMQVVLWFLSRLRRKRRDRFVDRSTGVGMTDEGSSWSEERLTGTSFRSLFHSRYLSALAALILVSACASTLIDLQYKWFLEEQFTGSEGQITEFFATVLSVTFIFSALVQLLLTNRVLKGASVLVGLLILPASLLAGSVTVFLFTTFWAVVLLKAADGCLRSSIDKSSTELLYIPIAGPETMAAKGVIDLMVYRFGDAFGAAVFLGLSGLFVGVIRPVSTAVLFAAAALGFLAWRVGAEYLHMLRESIESRHSPADLVRVELDGAAAQETLLAALKSRKPAKVRFALHQLLESHSDRFSDDITESGLLAVYPVEVVNAVAPLVEHSDQEIAAAALHLLIRFRPETYLKQLEQNCSGKEVPDSLSLHYMDSYVEDLGDFLQPECVLRWRRQADLEETALLARLMGKSGRREYLGVLNRWVRHQDRTVAREAIRALGRYRNADHLATLLPLLGDSWSRQAARSALVHFGEPLVEQLLRLLQNSEISMATKREIPLLLETYDSPDAIDALVTALYQPDAILSFRALKGLNKIRFQRNLPYGERTFSPALQIWSREYYELANMDHLLLSNESPAERLLKKAIQERMEWTIEKMFRGLELFLPPGDAYFSYLGFKSRDETLRENAIELIDLRVKGELRQTMQPIFTAHGRIEIIRLGRRLFGFSSNLDTVLSEALFSADPWLKCCIITAIKSQGRDDLKDRIRQLQETIHPIVRETARWALETWGRETSLQGRSEDS